MVVASDAQRIPPPPKQVCRGRFMVASAKSAQGQTAVAATCTCFACLRRSEIQMGVKTMKFPKLVAAMLMAGGAFLYAAPESQALEMFGAPGIGGLHDALTNVVYRGGGGRGGYARGGGGRYGGGGYRGGGRYAGGGYRGGGYAYRGGGYAYRGGGYGYRYGAGAAALGVGAAIGAGAAAAAHCGYYPYGPCY